MASPELCYALLQARDYSVESETDKDLEVDSDFRHEQLWKLGVIMYELLHGYSPWDDPDPRAMNINCDINRSNRAQLDEYRRFVDARRERILHDPLPISEDLRLTQDCVDVLNAMFAKFPADRPSIKQLAAYPWFQGSYLDSGADFSRPPRMGSDANSPYDSDPDEEIGNGDDDGNEETAPGDHIPEDDGNGGDNGNKGVAQGDQFIDDFWRDTP